ncbi:hypothetical protein SAY87_008229 [Trapa incisa]|uniref:LysM domain-containing protein n=1 Tax=Trapa incisa TaxID=236973 RepID=A0AAN7KHV7_9MYRT|nr:hypothetical protein SAY87_008229 [Trapa incisa]
MNGSLLFTYVSPYSRKKSKKLMNAFTTTSEAASWCCVFAVLGLIIVMASVRVDDDQGVGVAVASGLTAGRSNILRGRRFLDVRTCDEIYVVREGETLQTIGDKCGDPFIVERNPHIHDPDDVFPGLVIKIHYSREDPPVWKG